jgi:myo-inositol-1(or 4)-monophosphatase
VAELVRADKWDFRCFGSTVVLAYMATGRLAACVFMGAPPLHIAAGVALAREAGASVTDLRGKPWTVGSPTLVCAAGAGLAAELAAVAEATHALG